MPYSFSRGDDGEYNVDFFQNYWVETKLNKNKIHVCSNKLSFLSPSRVIMIYMKVALISGFYRQIYVSRLGRWKA